MVDDTVPEYEEWRELARQIRAEQDPIKIIAMVEKLLQLLEQETARRGPQPSTDPK